MFIFITTEFFGLPHPKLIRAQELTLRLLKTGTYPCPLRLNGFILRCYSQVCGALPPLEYMLWSCERVEDSVVRDVSRWEAPVLCMDLDYQLWAVQQAHDVTVRLGLPVPTWERPA